MSAAVLPTIEKCKILVVDDSASTLEVIQRNLTGAGYIAYTASNVEEAVDFLSQNPVDLLITDLKMPKRSGLDLVNYVRNNIPDMEVMLITGYPSITDAVQAVKGGAEEYLVKPFTDKELLSATERMFEKLLRQRKVNSREKRSSSFGIIGESKPMQRIFISSQ